MTTDELLAVVAGYCAEHYPERRPRTLVIVMGKARIELPIPARAVQRTAFVPNPFQEAVLAALEGKAMRTDALGSAAGDRSRLFKHPGGLRELRDAGLVDHHPRLGYFRPDAPPEDLS